MKYDKIVPEIIVGLGDNTTFDDNNSPTKNVVHLHINLENWLGDDLMENDTCFVITHRLKEYLVQSKYSGFEFEEMEVTLDTYFEDNYHLGIPLPVFYRLKVIGKESKDDLYIAKSYLYITNTLLKDLQDNFLIKNAQINPGRNEFDDFIDKMIAARKNKKD